MYVSGDHYHGLGVPKDAEKNGRTSRKLDIEHPPAAILMGRSGPTRNSKRCTRTAGFRATWKREQYDLLRTVGNIADIFCSNATKSTCEDLMDDIGGSRLGSDFPDKVFGEALKGSGCSFSFRNFGRRDRDMAW